MTASPLVLSVGPASSSIEEVLSFSAPNTAFPAVANPKTVYLCVFALLAPLR